MVVVYFDLYYVVVVVYYVFDDFVVNGCLVVGLVIVCVEFGGCFE